MTAAIQIAFWILFALNALLSPFILLMGLNALAFGVRDEMLWSLGYAIGMAFSLVLALKGMRGGALVLIMMTSILSFYIRHRVSG